MHMQGDTNGSSEPSPVNEDTGLFTGKFPIEVALHRLRMRLLDLTGRNRLINFKHGKSLQFVNSSIDGVFRRLTDDATAKVAIAPLPKPARKEWVTKGGRLARPEPKDYASSIGLETSYDLPLHGARSFTVPAGASLRTLFYAEDLGKHCRKLEREAKLALEETGVNMLYLVTGFLEFPEAPDSDKLNQAPLLCVPVAITKTEQGPYTSFNLNHTGEELSDNMSLREKVKRDFGVNLPEFDADADTAIETFFDQVTDVVDAQPNWRVRRMMTLTLLSFANENLIVDLNPENWPKDKGASRLLSHSIVRQVFEGRPSSGDAKYASDYPIDEHPRGDLPLIYDADSSQHSALIDVLEGHNLVIEGPPGTGKSQTITNLIAAAIQAGKKVLFVAEKLAALQVVKSRLTQAGLDNFVLELHSNKTSKKRVIEDISKRMNMHSPSRGELPAMLEQLEAKRKALKAYADLLNSKAGNTLDITLHSVMWRAELNRLRCGDAAFAVQELGYPDAENIPAGEFATLSDKLRYFATQFEPVGAYGPSHPFWGFFPTEFKPGDDLVVQRTLGEYAAKFEGFAQSMAGAAQLLGGSALNMGVGSSSKLLSVLAALAPPDPEEVDLALLPSLFPPSDPDGRATKSLLLDIERRQQQLDEMEKALDRALLSRAPASRETAEAAAKTLRDLNALGLGALAIERLNSMVELARQASTSALAALMDLTTIAESCGLPVAGTEADIGRVEALWTQMTSAPAHLLHLRHEGLRSADARQVLHEASRQLGEIQKTRSKFDETLYLDLLPEEAELRAAILVLREGDAWYRVLQSRWRKAASTHRRLERQKSKSPSSERLAQLEALYRHLKAERDWHANPSARLVAGPHFDGERTPVSELTALANWTAQTIEALEAAEVPRTAFDPITAERHRVAQIGSYSGRVEAARRTLGEFEALSTSWLAAALPRARKQLYWRPGLCVP